MRIIDKIPEVIQKHKKEYSLIEEEFNKQNEKYKSFLHRDHDFIGRILKYHLITEYYINEYLANKFPEIEFNSIELRYYQKLSLLPERDYRVEFVKNGLKELNKLRNRFSHTLDVKVDLKDLVEMKTVLSITRKEKKYQKPLDVIEDFTTVACTFLIVSPKEINDLFTKLFKELT